MKNALHKYGPWALVTGASSGIGAEFCRQLSAVGFNIVLVARREENLRKLAVNLEGKYKIKTKILPVDLSKPGFQDLIIEETCMLDIGLVVNNAGFALTGNFIDHSIEDELRLHHVNCTAPLLLMHHFAKSMVKKGRGGIINVSSASSFLPMPGWSHYAASKAYLTRISQGVWYELKEKNIDVLALCPSSVQTEFHKVAGTKEAGLDVTAVVKAGLKNLGKKPVIVPGLGTRIGIFVLRFLSGKTAIKLGATAVAKMKKNS